MRIEPNTDRDLVAMFFARLGAKCETGGCADGGPKAGPITGKPPRSFRIRQHPGLRLLQAVMRLAGPDAELVSHSEKPWASVTFSGTRHTITLTYSGITGIIAANALIETLPDHEFAIPQQLVADAAIISVVHDLLPAEKITIEAEFLLLEER